MSASAGPQLRSPMGPSAVARGRTYLPGRVRAAGAIGCCALAVAAGAWAVWPRGAPIRGLSTTTGQVWNMGQTLPDRPPAAAVAVAVAVTAIDPLPPAPAVPMVPSPPAVQSMGFWEDTAAAQQAEQAVATRAAQARAPSNPSEAGSNPDVATPGPASDYAQRMQSTKFADTAPIPPRFHVQYTVKKGTIFPCTPASPISSQLPGPVQCTVGQDVWSMDGSTILLPRGTQVNGTIERGLATGEERVFLIWTDALTPRPDLLAIPLDSPGADEMGQTGAPGDINDHLWKKIKDGAAAFGR